VPWTFEEEDYVITTTTTTTTTTTLSGHKKNGWLAGLLADFSHSTHSGSSSSSSRVVAVAPDTRVSELSK
jgi:hypothetical protein